MTVDGRATDWKTSTHAPGESTDFAHGILFVDIETGAGERWWASGEPVPTEYTVSPNGQWLSATTIWTGTQRVLDRDSARSFSWSTQTQRAVESPVAGGRLLVRSQRSGCTFALIDLGGGEPEIVAFDVPPDDRTCGSTSGVVDSYGRGAFLMVNSDGAGARLFHVDSDGALSEVPLAPAQWRRLSLGADGESVATVAMSGDGGVGALRLDILSWGGRLTRSVSFDQVPLPEKIGPVLLSPDLGSIAWRARIPLPTLQGAGGEEMWPAVVLADLASGSVRYRAVRATLSNGLRSFGWIADGSAVVVGTELGYALLSLDGEIADLPFGPVGHFAPIPLPSPDDPTLFLYDGAVVRVDGASGGATTPKGSAWWRRSSYDWGTTSRELRIKRWGRCRSRLRPRRRGRSRTPGFRRISAVREPDPPSHRPRRTDRVASRRGTRQRDRSDGRTGRGSHRSRVRCMRHGRSRSVQRRRKLVDPRDYGDGRGRAGYQPAR